MEQVLEEATRTAVLEFEDGGNAAALVLEFEDGGNDGALLLGEKAVVLRESFCPLMMDPHDELPPPPPLPPNVVPIKAEDAAKESPPNKPTKPTRLPIARPGLGKKGQPIQLLANHFKVSVKSSDDFFHHYYVKLKYEDDQPVEGKVIGRKVIDKLQHTYCSELSNKDFAYDGEKSLFTVGALPQVNNEFTVVLEDIGTGKLVLLLDLFPCYLYLSNTMIGVPHNSISYLVAGVLPMGVPVVLEAIRGQESENSLEALRVLDIILRQHSAKQGCLLVRQSSFHNNPASFVDLGGGVMGCRGFHSSFRGTQSGLSLNVDVSTTMIVKPGPVIDFLLANQNVDHPDRIDWQKAKRALKNLRIKAAPGNSEFKVVGLSDRKCIEQTFPWRQRNGNNGDINTVEITVSDYFLRHKGIELRYSGNFPCIHAGRSKRPTYFPVELCTLVPLQRYTKALSTLQRSSLVEKSRQKPQERMSTLNDALKRSNYDSDPMLMACGISIAPKFTQIEGRVLQAPKACKFLDEKWEPKFTVIVAQKNHHTRFFQTGSPENVPPGTVVDKQVCHPKNFDFYMCAHAGMIGTSRPTHYHDLHDEIGFTADALEEFVHSLSYVYVDDKWYQRSTTAISIVAPISYAHLAAAQVGTFMKFEDMSDASSSQGGHTSVGSVPVPELPRLHENVRSTMFFC
ncbi:hypothetical protein ACQ4PT_071238 [Festuca glaucescens]